MTIVTFGEIMLRLSPPGFQRFVQARSLDVVYGGGEANVAASLAHYGLPVEYVTRLPDNDIGDACLSYLRQYGVGTSYVVRGGERLGIYFLEVGAAQRGSKVIYDRAGSSFATIEPGMIDWQAVFADADWFHWTGITPAISEGAADVCLEAAQTAKADGADRLVRPELPQEPVEMGQEGGRSDARAGGLLRRGHRQRGGRRQGLRHQAPDTDVTSGKVEADAYVHVCDELAGRFPNLKTVAITLRGSLSASHNTWSAILWQQGRIYTAPCYDITTIVDRVGGGDSFCAGLIYGLRTYPGLWAGTSRCSRR